LDEPLEPPELGLETELLPEEELPRLLDGAEYERPLEPEELLPEPELERVTVEWLLLDSEEPLLEPELDRLTFGWLLSEPELLFRSLAVLLDPVDSLRLIVSLFPEFSLPEAGASFLVRPVS